MTLQFRRLSPAAILPSRAHPADAGLDLCSIDRTLIGACDRGIIRTGWAVSIPPGWYGRVAPRSGLAAKHGIDVLAGVIDCGYTGEVRVILANHGRESFRIQPGDRIAQLIIECCAILQPEEVEALDDTARGDGGFGSTGVEVVA